MNDLEHTLYMGFAFSLNKDSTPGTYNCGIAQCILDAWEADKSDGRAIWAGIQSELYDALWKLKPKFVETHLPLRHVVGPPLLTKTDLVTEDRTAKVLAALRNTALTESPQRTVVGLLRKQIAQELNAMLRLSPPADEDNCLARIRFPDQLAALLNRVMLEAKFLKDVVDARLTLGNTLDEKKRDNWIEERTLPEPADAIGFFQSRRLGRTIVDWLLTDATQGRMKANYLNTMDVCNTLLDQAGAERIRIGNVKVFGYPEHSPRCTTAVLQSLWLRGLSADIGEVTTAERISVTDVNNPSGTLDRIKDNGATGLPRAGGLRSFQWQWDPSTAQQWCRSLMLWKRHEGRP